MNKLIIASLLASMGNDTIDLTAEEVISYAKAMAVHIDFACGIVSVRLGEETRITATSSLKRYDYNNGVVSFTDEAGQWVLPSIDILGHDITAALEKLHYKKGLWVPFSNGDKPKDFMERWLTLQDIQSQQSEAHRQKTFKEYCEKNSIQEIPDEFLEMYFLEITPQGMETRFFDKTDTYRPESISEFGGLDIQKLGTFCQNNGVIRIIDSKGRSFVAPVSGTINQKYLKSLGFRENSMFVPLSNGEILVDEWMANRWCWLKRDAA